MDETNLSYLLSRYFSNFATGEEIDELMSLVELPENEPVIAEIMTHNWESFVTPEAAVFSPEQSSRILSVLLPPMPVQHKSIFRLYNRSRIAAAILLLIGAYWLFTRKKPEKGGPVKELAAVVHDVLPGSRGAILTLADGQQIELDSAGKGLLAQQGSTSLVKEEGGSLHYDTASHSEEVMLFNTLTTARGKQFRVELPDGTHVWLNAASSLRYPTRFGGNQRTVELSGEAYFEVARDVTRPFLVNTDGQSILVLGTSFNINAYRDEPAVLTTLIEGSVKISGHILKPGQQSVVSASGLTKVVNGDTAQAIAWTRGAFSFHKADFSAVMRQLARWYNVEVEYTGAVPPGEFSGEIGRNLTLSQVLRLLTQTRIHYRIEKGNKIFILSDN